MRLRKLRTFITNPLGAYQFMLVAAALSLAALAAVTGEDLGSGWAVAGLAVAAAVAERGRVRLGGPTEASISILPTVFAAAVFGPPAAMLIGAASFAGDFPPLLPQPQRDNRSPGDLYLKWGIYTSIRIITGGLAGLAASAAAGVAPIEDVGQLVVATVVAALVAEACDSCFAGITLRLRGGDAKAFLRLVGPVILGNTSLYTPVVALLAVAYAYLSPLTLPLFFVPALAAQRLFGLYQQQRALAENLGQVNERLEAANLSFATALVATLDARDRYTAGHSAAVSIYARDIAVRLGLPVEQQQLAQLAGLVHDIGKIGLPAGLLEKPGALTLDERRQMEQHSVIGERILRNVETYADVADIVRHHHERVDGQGYPDGMSHQQIPLLSRIIAVADAYNAMTSDRPYRDAMPSRVARLRLAQAVESQFDTAVVAAFEAILAGTSEDYRLARDPVFRFELHEESARDRDSEPPDLLAALAPTRQRIQAVS